MADDAIWAIPTRFHREVFVPDFERIDRLEVYGRSSPPDEHPVR